MELAAWPALHLTARPARPAALPVCRAVGWLAGLGTATQHRENQMNLNFLILTKLTNQTNLNITWNSNLLLRRPDLEDCSSDHWCKCAVCQLATVWRAAVRAATGPAWWWRGWWCSPPSCWPGGGTALSATRPSWGTGRPDHTTWQHYELDMEGVAKPSCRKMNAKKLCIQDPF